MIELLIVVMIFAALAGIVMLNLVGLLSRGREGAYQADRRTIQMAVDSYYTHPGLRGLALGGIGYSTFPTEYTGDGAPGLVTRAVNVIISMPVLLDKSLLRTMPASASPINGGENGHYVWIIDGTTGTVYGCPGGSAGSEPHTWDVTSYGADCGSDGQYP